MIYIETNSQKPAINLAYEDYFLHGKSLDEDIFMLWRNEPAIVIGRFQNSLEEINSSFAEAHQIKIVRRISGGGAVYHDLGNLCFSFILRDIAPQIADKSKYIRPLADALASMGVRTEMTRRNDLMVNGKKISGNAMAVHKNRLLFHGTLLFDTDLEILEEALRSSAVKIESKAVRSIRSKVTNLKEYLPQNMDIDLFKQSLKRYFFANMITSVYEPDRQDIDAIQELAKKKYETWEWNFGQNPESTVRSIRNFSEGVLEITITLNKGLIKSVELKSTFGMPFAPGEIEKRLINLRYTSTDIQNALNGLDIEWQPGSISKKELIQAIIKQ